MSTIENQVESVEERYIREYLAMLRNRYEEAVTPYITRLAAIRSMRVEPIYIPKNLFKNDAEQPQFMGFDVVLDPTMAPNEMKLVQPQAQEPVAFISPKQLELIKDPDGEFGHYIPMRKTSAGNFVLALYTAPKQAQEPVNYEDRATIAGLEASIGHLSALVNQQLLLLEEVDINLGVDGMGVPLDDDQSPTIAKVREHLAAMAPPETAPKQAEPSWQPIESAPKDGTVIDLWHEEFGRWTSCNWGLPDHTCGEMGSLCDSDVHSMDEGWVTDLNEITFPASEYTHWMPLPKPPEAK